MRTSMLMATTALMIAGAGAAVAQPGSAPQAATATPGKPLRVVLVPKVQLDDRIGALFEQAHVGAEQAAKELRNPNPLQFDRAAPSQIETVTTAAARGAKTILISNNSGDDIAPAIKAAHDKGIKVVSWDSPVPAADLHVAQIDFSQTGKVLADMALSILGPDGGKFAILAIAPDGPGPSTWAKDFQAEVRTNPRYTALEQVDIAYAGADLDRAYQEAIKLADKHPDLKLIMAPDSNSVLSAAKAMRDSQRDDRVKVSGFGLPSEMRPFVASGGVPRFALWSFTDLGYLTYYAGYMLATGAIKPEAGQQFTAGRLGRYTIVQDPTRPQGLRVVLGPWAIYDKTTVDVIAAR